MTFSFVPANIHTYFFLQFAGPNEATMASGIVAGPSSSVVIDKQGMYWMAGKVSKSATHSELTSG